MSILSVLIAAVTTYTIPSGTTYTLQPSDPNITAETLVNIESGATLDLNGRTQRLVGFTGSGVVTNGTAMMTLAGGLTALSTGRFSSTKVRLRPRTRSSSSSPGPSRRLRAPLSTSRRRRCIRSNSRRTSGDSS